MRGTATKNLSTLLFSVLLLAVLPVSAQEEEVGAAALRASELLGALETQGGFEEESQLLAAWIEAVDVDLGPRHPVLVDVLFFSGTSLYELSDYGAALEIFERLVDLSTSLEGPEGEGTLRFRGWLAGMHKNLGQYAEAKSIEMETLELLGRVLGKEHPETLLANANLASTLRSLGDLSGALEREEEVLRVRRQVLGEDHPDTLIVKANLAVTLGQLGDLSSALQHEEEVFIARSRVLGEDHLDTLLARANLAVTLGKLGDLSGALRQEEEVLLARCRVLGEDHLDTLSAKANFAVTLGKLGDLPGALELEEEVVLTRRRVLGEDHLDTLLAKANFAVTLGKLGDLSGALELEEEVLLARGRILGEDHPDTLRAKAGIAATLRELGDLSGALELEEEVLLTRRQVLGDEHPDTLTAQANLAGTLGELGDLSGALRHEEEVLRGRRRVLGDEHPDTLTSKANLAATLGSLGDLSGARQREEEVLLVRRRVLGEDHPDTLKGKGNLATTLRALGDLSGARQLEVEILAVLARVLGEEHPDALNAKANLAVTLRLLGDLEGARQREEEVLLVSRRVLGDEHPATLKRKGNLAVTLGTLGDLAGARQLGEEVLTVQTRVLGEEHPDTLTSKANLAATLGSLGDLASACQLVEEVLAVQTRVLGEDHPNTLVTKGNLAGTLASLGDRARARQLEEEILSVRRRILGEEHPDTLVAQANLAVTLGSLGDWASARQLGEEVLLVRRRILGEGHPDTLTAMANLASTLASVGDLDGSRDRYEELIESRARMSGPDYRPNTLPEAEELVLLARTLWYLGQPGEAYSRYLLGLDALEAQALRIDFAEEDRSEFKERYSYVYRETVSTGLELDRQDDAFLVLERYRTQSLMNLLRWSRPGTGIEIPEAWRIELAEIAQRYDWLTGRIDAIYPDRDPALFDEQARLRRRREVIQGQIIELRREMGGAPDPLGLDEICQLLDPGTVMLAFSIGTVESHLFVLGREHGVEVHSIESSARQLWTQVGRLRSSDLERSQDSEDGEADESRRALAVWLFDALLSPAADRLDAAERVLVLPDGPLHFLPFPALTRPIEPTQSDPRGWQYLAEWKPFHTVQSATVYAELQDRRRKSVSGAKQPEWQWVGFGDPLYPASRVAGLNTVSPSSDGPGGRGDDAGSILRSVIDRGLWDDLTPLPHSLREIEEIQTQFPADRAKAFLDREATEDEARRLLGTTRIAHFAAHGLADEDYPLDSFLALSLLEGDDLEHNGLLQAWEIIDHLELDADLVVLSACVTAFGPNRGGEGLISLSRAFQIAGARSVLASLWGVNDQSTSELMIRFYRNLLEKGMTKDVALQQAQIELIRGPIETVDEAGNPVTRDFSAPYHWAAFQLIGDWQ